MTTLIEILNIPNLKSLKISDLHETLVDIKSDQQNSIKSETLFCSKRVGSVESNLEVSEHSELVEQLAPLLYLLECGYGWDNIIKLLSWVSGACRLVPDVTDWIGIYYKANYYLDEETTDLVLGPYFGESTSHTRIPLERGLCGLALREERVINVADVHQDDRHIACSIKTNSELIIPLKDHLGQMVAELDIDCNRLGAFSSEIEEKFKEYCQSFSNHWAKR